MRQTGHDLPSLYKETSTGGLATSYRSPIARLGQEISYNREAAEQSEEAPKLSFFM